ncbi:hypothetical protein O0I10_012694 [Lichtheimia ornata]|uniref:F-box domain-containing protein n=1 Tax=Lichtheimia ornata TaxID=688661 RepID=A0AAD7UQK2_9FUNG|nr:uncharacterized protein O0I10_012694 [Lichtheimia ornata]KAJ8651747.1 hypothetical protein O0I10_012694 [Lichtheimia ornata]
MKGLLDLPNEIMLRILHYVEPVQISTFLSTLRNLITLEDNEQLWQSLAGTFGITCKQPYGSWKELGFSGDLMTTCPHLQAVDCPCSLLRATSAIKHDTPCSCGQQSWACLEYGICLGCRDGTPHCLSNRQCTHAVVLRLSVPNFMEVWCSSCSRTLGLWEDPWKEQYMVRSILRTYISPEQPPGDKTALIQQRREAEQYQFWMWFRNPSLDASTNLISVHGCYLVDQEWFASWVDFLKGISEIPGRVSNGNLLAMDGSIKPDLALGRNFVLLSERACSFITRIYGIDGSLASIDHVKNKPEYARLVHSVRVQEQMAIHQRVRPIVVSVEQQSLV